MKRPKPVNYTPRALADLEEIHDYIAEQNPMNAARFIDQIEASSSQLGRTPAMGRLREELAPGVRSLALGKYVVFYRIKERSVEILRVVRGCRDIEAIWEE